MRNTVAALLVIFGPLSSLACPGGNLKSLVVQNQQIAELNFTDGSLKITDGTSQIVAISTMSSRAYSARELCGHELACSNSELIDIDLQQDPEARVIVHIREAGQRVSHVFRLTNFFQSRDINSCSEVVTPLR